MRSLRAFLVRVKDLLTARQRERELADEIEAHLQLHIDDNIRAGMAPADAVRAAHARLGRIEAIKDAYRDRSRVALAENFLQDVWYGLRRLRLQPGFTVLVVLTLAIGVGANAAMFGLVDALMFRAPDHVRQPERLVAVRGAENYVRYQDLGAALRTADLAAYARETLSLGRGPSASEIRTECVTTGFFEMLGAAPALGRTFMPGEDAPGREGTVVLAHGFWQRQFGGEAGVLGTTATIAGRRFTVIGVAPRDFRGVEIEAVDAWILLAAAPEACAFTGTNLLRSEGSSWLTTIGRIRDGVTFAQAASELAVVEQAREQAGKREAEETAQLEPLYEWRGDSALRESRLALWLAGGATVLMLIACANVAGLLSMRALDRRREIAVRIQLGASRPRVFAQLLVENIIAAFMCGVVALGVIAWVGTLLRGFLPFGAADELLNARSAAVLAAFALAAGCLSGIVPAIQAARSDVVLHLRSGKSGAHGRAAFRNVLLTIQIALALVLVVGAGLFVRSVQNFRGSFAYDLDKSIIAAVDFKKAGYRGAEDIRGVYDRMLERVTQLPDVESASLSSGSLLGSAGASTVTSVGRTQSQRAEFHMSTSISPEHFHTLGLRVVQGRAFTAADDARSAPVVILDETIAAEVFPGENPVGKCAWIGRSRCREVVGIVESGQRVSSTRRQSDAEFFVPLAQSSRQTVPQMLMVRPRTDSSASARAIAAAIRGAAPDLPFVKISRVGDLANIRARSWLMGATIFSLFGVMAIALSAIGIYGTLAFSMRQRTSEIGVRLALGATARNIAGLVLRHASIVVGVGLIAGAAAAMGMTRWIKSLLFEVAPWDPLTFVAASMVILLAGLAGGVIPAVRAARTDPAVALRYD